MSTMQFWLQLKLNAGYAQPLWCISGMADGQESEVEGEDAQKEATGEEAVDRDDASGRGSGW